MRKIDCIYFRITRNTNFKKKFTSFVWKFFRENATGSQKSKNLLTQQALKRRVREQFRCCCFTTVL